MKKSFLILLGVSLFFNFVSAQFASWNSYELTLTNGVVKRTIQLPSDGKSILTNAYKPVNGEFKYFPAHHSDFQFELNGKSYSGESSWKLIKIQHQNDSLEGDGAAVTIQSADNQAEVTIKFLLYPGLPLIRKNLIVKNIGNSEAALESVDVEKFSISGYEQATFSWIYSD